MFQKTNKDGDMRRCSFRTIIGNPAIFIGVALIFAVRAYPHHGLPKGLQMVRIEPGAFKTMLLSKSVQVKLKNPYEIGSYEVTQGFWLMMMGYNPSKNKKGGMDCPVENVSWNDVQAFLQSLKELYPDKNYRLPTRMELEYAFRASPRDEDLVDLDQKAWSKDNSANVTHPVGMKQPNIWGLYDSLGNVYEWCSDWDYCMGPLPEDCKFPSDILKDPVGPKKGKYKIAIGGSYLDSMDSLHYNASVSIEPVIFQENIGFRLARTLP